MPDYDTMSVHELVMEIYYAGAEIKSDVRQMCEDALRRAVIREATVGEITIEQHEGYMSPDPMFTVGAKSKLQAGEFWLVKKEG
jgi:hypothetical protein